MTPAGLARVSEEIERSDHRVVVECGSGYSTLVLARLLAARGGAVVSLEHDAGWRERVAAAVEEEGLSAAARIVHAPLEPHPLARAEGGWYATSALDELPDRIDLLLVDGPPASEPDIAESRYPALPLLGGRLGPNGLVILDDIGRSGERRVLDAWEAETAFRFELRPGERIALGRRR
jgi:predicted O-methyltransferase YrrM